MPWLESYPKPRHRAARRGVAVLAVVCAPLAGCGQQQTDPANSSGPAPPHAPAPPADTATLHELDEQSQRYWVILQHMTDNRDTASVAYDPAVLFRAEVLSSDRDLPEISVRVVYRHFDPRYYLTLRITSPPACMPEWRAGDVVAFHIHSPALLFQTHFGQPDIGVETRFALAIDPEDGIIGIDHAPEPETNEPIENANPAPPR